MTVSVVDAIDRVQTLMEGVSGIRAVPDNPPEKLPSAPTILVYMGPGEWHCEAMQKRWLGDIYVELFIGRNQPDLPTAFKPLPAYCEAIANALEGDPTLNNTSDQIRFPVRQEAPVLTTYAELEYVMVRFAVPVSCTNAIS